ncbi:MAG: sigma-70 family RNA polymerase sigma factor [Streptomycetaceae bacterium]|nr:sigma-70 family RNA polymerase sigma factor [Streptomycetaceae bacterium]
MSRSEHTPWRSPSPPAHRRPAPTGAHRAVSRAPRRGPRPGSGPRTGPAAGQDAASALASDAAPGADLTAGSVPQQLSPLYEPYLDGLFTYCLSVLCEHATATAALGDMLAVAERHRGRLRHPELRRAWFYALARWACLRRLAQGRPASGSPETPQSVADERRRELAALAWPEAAGTTPEQREALELSVRHQLSAREIAAVLGVARDTARSLLSRAACKVERTRTALAVVELGSCPAVARLSGDAQVLLGTTLRRELVRHVDECPACRLTAEQAVAAGPWPGTATPAVLALVEAPRSAVGAAMVHAMRAIRSAGRSDGRLPHFDRRGFPLDVKERAARRTLMRHRALTTTVVAAVVAAPTLALWAAYRNAPQTGEAQDTTSVSVTDTDGANPTDYGYTYQKSGNAKVISHPHATAPRLPSGTPPPKAAAPADDSARPPRSPDSPHPAASSAPSSPRPGWITVAAQPQGSDTQITVTDEGGSPVHWTASTDASWLHLSTTSGTLQPGRSVTITATVDQAAQPAGRWRAKITFEPSHSTVIIEGQGADPSPSGSPTPSPTPASGHTSKPEPERGSASGHPPKPEGSSERESQRGESQRPQKPQKP